VIRGKVQGVGFRWFVREAARRAELAGWVRNLPDGSVALEAAGTPEGIAFLLDAVRHGPPRSRVDEVSVSDGTAHAELTRPFAVVR
jgi:acylphosphatase